MEKYDGWVIKVYSVRDEYFFVDTFRKTRSETIKAFLFGVGGFNYWRRVKRGTAWVEGRFGKCVKVKLTEIS